MSCYTVYVVYTVAACKVKCVLEELEAKLKDITDVLDNTLPYLIKL